MAGVTVRAVAAAAVCLLFAAGPATANGVTFPIAEGVSGPYRYEVGVGPFSPLRKALFVAVTLMADGSPVTDADVTVTVSVDGSLAWTVADRPWEDGDQLMLRIAEVVP